MKDRKILDRKDLESLLENTKSISELLEKSSSTFSKTLSDLISKRSEGGLDRNAIKEYIKTLNDFIDFDIEYLTRRGKISQTYAKDAKEFLEALNNLARTFKVLGSLGDRVNVDYLSELEKNLDRFLKNLGEDFKDFASLTQKLALSRGTLGLKGDLGRQITIEDIYRAQYLTKLVKEDKPIEAYYFQPNVEDKVLRKIFGKQVEENIYSKSLEKFSVLLSNVRSLEKETSLPALLFTERGRYYSELRKTATLNTAESLNALKENLTAQIKDVRERLQNTTSLEERAKLQAEELELHTKLLNVYKQEYEVVGEVIKNFRQLQSVLKDTSEKLLDRTFSLTRNPFVDIATKSLRTAFEVGSAVYRATDSFFSNIPFFAPGKYQGPLTREPKTPPVPQPKYKITKPPEGTEPFPKAPIPYTKPTSFPNVRPPSRTYPTPSTSAPSKPLVTPSTKSIFSTIFKNNPSTNVTQNEPPTPGARNQIISTSSNVFSSFSGASNFLKNLGKTHAGGLLSSIGINLAAQGVYNYLETGNLGEALKRTINRSTLPGIVGGATGAYAGATLGFTLGSAIPGIGNIAGAGLGFLGGMLLGNVGANIGDKFGKVLNNATDSLYEFKDKVDLSAQSLKILPFLLTKSIQSIFKNPYAPGGGLFLKGDIGIGNNNIDNKGGTKLTNLGVSQVPPTTPPPNPGQGGSNIFGNFINFLKNGFSSLFNNLGLGKLVGLGAGVTAGALAGGADFYLQAASVGYDLAYQRFVMARMLPQFIREPYGGIAGISRQFVPGGTFFPKEMGFTSEEYLAQAARLSSSMIIKSSEDLKNSLYNAARASNLFGTSLAEAGDLVAQSRRALLDERKAMQAAYIATGEYSGFSKAIAEGFIQASSSLAIRQNLNTQSYLTSLLTTQTLFLNRGGVLAEWARRNPELARTTFESFNQFIRSGLEGNAVALGMGIRAGLTPREMLMGATPENMQRILSRFLIDTGISSQIVGGKILPGARERLIPILQMRLGFGNISPDAFNELLVSVKQGKWTPTSKEVLDKLSAPLPEVKTPDDRFSRQLDKLSTSNQLLVQTIDKNLEKITDLNDSINKLSSNILNLSDRYVPALIALLAKLTGTAANELDKLIKDSGFEATAKGTGVSKSINYNINTPQTQNQTQYGTHVIVLDGRMNVMPMDQLIENLQRKLNKK